MTALRLRGVIEKSKIKLNVKPISIRQIMMNMENIPFPPSKKTKVSYMWRDIQRCAEYCSLPVPHVSVSYPLKDFDRANLIGIVMNQDGRYVEYLEQTYRAWCMEGLEAGSEPNIRNVNYTMGLNMQSVIDGASSSDIKKNI